MFFAAEQTHRDPLVEGGTDFQTVKFGQGINLFEQSSV
jgi:hypothetical protein